MVLKSFDIVFFGPCEKKDLENIYIFLYMYYIYIIYIFNFLKEQIKKEENENYKNNQYSKANNKPKKKKFIC